MARISRRTRRPARASRGDAPGSGGERRTAFVHANWRLHADLAAISPNPLLRSLYTSLLQIVESHTLEVLPACEQPLQDYIRARHTLHAELVDALERRDREESLRLIHAHNTTADR